ncbi:MULTISPECIES: xanthine dehydrogenase family protein molybdopterin-binding subunit [Rhizobium]|jgi:CO/xanthine dehydrogenase Mo-binding subunit|uniref:Carbon-monoxide dehydrogenase large subunit n=1 Tax=Rhizobium lusitanum TaxID=293958 RepID=A0A1C3XI44_9HYPH|nr:carbon-monoxide dehydrogenase large subunit [Rhizobium lusitanum]
MSFVGKPVERVEDEDLLSARTRFVGALSFDNMLHMHVVRSPHPHACLNAIGVDRAKSVSGVVAIFTGSDTRELAPIGFRRVVEPELSLYQQPVLALDRLRYVGEPVAIIIATDPRIAEDAAELVTLDVECLPPVSNAVAPGPDDGLGLHVQEAAGIDKSYGDIAAAFEAAAHRFSISCEIARQTAVPMETRGALAVPHGDASGFDFYGAAKVVHANRAELARILCLDPNRVVLREGHVGGGFGVRGELYPEDVLVAFAALRLQRAVRWIEDRREHFLATNHSRGQVVMLDAAVDHNGVILGLTADIVADQGAYLRTHEIKVADLSCAFLPGPYRIPAYRAQASVRLTNKTPCGTYRAPGRFEATFAMERMMDTISRVLKIDPIQVRRRNLIPASEMPFDRDLTAAGKKVRYDSGDYGLTLDKAVRAFDFEGMRKSAADRRAAGEHVGVGLAMFVEKSGVALRETASLCLSSDGSVELVTGASSLGQGLETVLSQIAADSVGLDMSDFKVVRGQTDRISQSGGTFGSRATIMAGSAVHAAGQLFRQAIIKRAAELFDAAPEAVHLQDGRLEIAGQPVDLSRLHMGNGDNAPALKIETTFDAENVSYPYGVHIAQVSVDPDTLQVRAERYCIAYDIGRAVNPDLVKGQLVGGAVQGIGGALFEEITYSNDGYPHTTGLSTYAIPKMADIPAFDVLVLEDWPSPTNPLGLKGAGEGGINAAGAAVAAAVEDAFSSQLTPYRLPMTAPYLFKLKTANERRRRQLDNLSD